MDFINFLFELTYCYIMLNFLNLEPLRNLVDLQNQIMILLNLYADDLKLIEM